MFRIIYSPTILNMYVGENLLISAGFSVTSLFLKLTQLESSQTLI